MLTKMIYVKNKEKEVIKKKAKESLKSNNNKKFGLITPVIKMIQHDLFRGNWNQISCEVYEKLLNFHIFLNKTVFY